MSNFTKEQLEAIEKDGSNIIVSAGAGSGKTTVLTARVLRKVKSGIPINRLLILTFTNEAAMNMKTKIRKELECNNMYESLKLIDQAYITTFDSYALSIVKKYHYLLNLGTDVNIVPSSIINIKRSELLGEIFEDMYGNDKFDKFIKELTFKDDAPIKKCIIKMNSLLDLNYDKEAYLKNYITKFYSDENIDSLIQEYFNYVLEKKDEFLNIINEISDYDPTFASNLNTLYESITNSNSYDELKNIINIKMPSVPRGSSEEVKEKKKELTTIKDEIIDLTGETKEELKQSILKTKDYVEVIIDIILKLDNEIYKFKQDTNNYEFIDIAKMAIKVVKENAEVREELKNFYDEIMIDEYQDTNDLQELFVSLIENNNLYMVGDIKQSIYRFRNANPNIFKNKYDKYSKGINGYKIDLLKNFRSREEVLSNINNIFDYIMDDELGNADYKVNHRMIYGNNSYDLKANQNYNLEILNYNFDKEYKHEEIEAFLIATDIKNKIENNYQILDNGVLRNFTYNDVCIIIDRTTSFEIYKKIFEYMHIPLTLYTDEVLNEEKDIYVLKSIINLIINIHDNNYDVKFKYYFISIARSYLFNYNDNDIFQMFKNNNFKNNEIYSLCLEISKQIDSMTNDELVKIIIEKFNMYENIIKVGDVEKGITRLDYMIDLGKTLSNLGYTPYDFQEYLNTLENVDIKYSYNESNNNSVKIMTIHKSKGLEFNICYFPGLYKSFNIQELNDLLLYSKKYGFVTPYYDDGISKIFIKSLCKNEYLINEVSEKIRLFYVALTRTKEKIILLAPLNESYNNISNIVPFITRKKYRSFLDMLNSIKEKLLDYIVDIDYHKTSITKDYENIKNIDYISISNDNNKRLLTSTINIANETIEERHFSKNHHIIYTEEEKEKMEFGSYMHELYEMVDFNNIPTDIKNIDKINNLLNKIDLKNAKVYKEYEFVYNDGNEKLHGIIDLIVEYNNHINIYDYKLKNIEDLDYKKQLSGYKKYLTAKTGKKVNTYIYSILDDNLLEIL